MRAVAVMRPVAVAVWLAVGVLAWLGTIGWDLAAFLAATAAVAAWWTDRRATR